MTLALPLVAADFLAALHAGLLPTGDIWPAESGTIQSEVLGALMLTYERQTGRSNNLLIDAFPASAVELLPEWEATLGLPDPCAGQNPTIQARQAQVVVRLSALDGPTIAFFITTAATLGYDVSIQQFVPFRAGRNRAGDPVQGALWAYAWQVFANAVSVSFFRAGISRAGDPLCAWGNPALECETKRLAPAHTTVSFAYGTGVAST